MHLADHHVASSRPRCTNLAVAALNVCIAVVCPPHKSARLIKATAGACFPASDKPTMFPKQPNSTNKCNRVYTLSMIIQICPSCAH